MNGGSKKSKVVAKPGNKVDSSEYGRIRTREHPRVGSVLRNPLAFWQHRLMRDLCSTKTIPERTVDGLSALEGATRASVFWHIGETLVEDFEAVKNTNGWIVRYPGRTIDTIDHQAMIAFRGERPILVDHEEGASYRFTLDVNDMSFNKYSFPPNPGEGHKLFLPVYVERGDQRRMTGILTITGKDFKVRYSEEEQDDVRLEQVMMYTTGMMGIVSYMRENTHDQLTGLPGREMMWSEIDNLLASHTERRKIGEHGKKFAVFMLDIDHFKGFNDIYGHGIGDIVLREYATCLLGSVRRFPEPGKGKTERDNFRPDAVFRYGGEEFVIVCVEVDGSAGAMVAAERVRQNVENMTIAIGKDKGVSIECSVGVMLITDEMEIRATKIRDLADHALYVAKERGRNQCVLWTPDIEKEFKRMEKEKAEAKANEVVDKKDTRPKE